MPDCAICLSRDGFNCEITSDGRDGSIFSCPVCGEYAASRNAINEALHPNAEPMTRLRRAVLSHQIRVRPVPLETMITTADIDRFIESEPSLPSIRQQILNAIRFIGDAFRKEFQPLRVLPPSFQAAIGALNRRYAEKLVKDLKARGLVNAIDASTLQSPDELIDIELTLSGWELFDREQSGHESSRMAFIAMKFGDETLDPLVRDHVKPALSEIGYKLIDLRDVARAGVIDNILRAEIRDSAFVLVDLTHDNSGAYWEAGYAEGVGKPVIYICNKQKFDEANTHFDTNHCTTVLWDADDMDAFKRELAATVRRSLGFIH